MILNNRDEISFFILLSSTLRDWMMFLVMANRNDLVFCGLKTFAHFCKRLHC